MIDMEKAQKAFKEYTSHYGVENGKVINKIKHTQGVVRAAKYIAEKLQLEIEDIQLAQLIGLLHDIGRFEQVKRYNTYADKDSINHGKFGVHLLFEENLIREFIKESKYDEMIKQAILNHNIDKIPEDLKDEKILLHSKIIRDADKTDIYRALVEENIQDTYCCDSMSKDSIKEEVVRQFKEEYYIDYGIIENAAERMITHFAYVYDFNYPFGLEIVKKEDYINRLANKYEFEKEDTKRKIQECAKIANEQKGTGQNCSKMN